MVLPLNNFARVVVYAAFTNIQILASQLLEFLIKLQIQKICGKWTFCQALGGVRGYSSFILFIDVFSGYIVPVPLKNENSSTIENILEENILKIFGIPETISSDNARNLNGPEIQRILQFYGIKRHLTMPYSPESHGLVEKSNRYLVERTKILADQYNSTWLDVLTIAALMVNTIPRVQLKNHSPYFLMFLNEPQMHFF